MSLSVTSPTLTVWMWWWRNHRLERGRERCLLPITHSTPQVLGEEGTSITTHAKNGAYEEFSRAVENTSQAVCQLTEAAAQAAYLVGIADPSSTAATPGLVDEAQFARANQAISTACHNLLNPASNQQQVGGGL